MKKLIPFLMLMAAGISSALAQGTVTFVNSGNFPTTADRLVYFDPGTGVAVPLVGTNFVAQLFFGDSATSLQAHTAAPSRFRVPTTLSPGTWSGATRTLTGFGTGSTVVMQVRVWDENNPSIVANSATFNYTVPAPGSPAQQFLMDNFRMFTYVVPEPSVIGLGLLGAGALFLLRRRKA
ncbi:MAG: PEP-CTERM sorting domain-containing protein [Verrucomicrobia subdivision 3 bacterium]|nr:PEP-CTERM sorting domain-containing protein [Limisphaerales bacterium]